MYLYFEATALLYSLAVITFIILLAGVFASAVLWKKGKAKSLHRSLNKPAIVKAFFLNCILQVQILKESFVRWLMHFCIFIGFLGLFAQTSVMAFMSHLIPKDSFIAKTFFIVEDPVGGIGSRVLDVWGDFFGLLLLTGCVIAIVRRYIVKSKQLETLSKDTVSIVLLTAITVTGFICEAIRLVDPQYASVAAYSFIGYPLSIVFNALGIGHESYKSWIWFHAFISFFFLAYIPFSKAWHIFVSPVEILLDASERTPA